jgi:predicted DNA-binding transcriptional regulator YafY
MAGRNSQVSRILRILNLLDMTPQGFTAAELTEQLNDRAHSVGKRTVYRDLQALQQAGFPLGVDDAAASGEAQRWKLSRNVRVNDYLALTVGELAALWMARAALKPLEGTYFHESIQSAFAKIEEHLGTKALDHLAELSKELAFEPGPRWGLSVSADIVDTLGAGCREGQVVRIDYEGVNGGPRRWREVGGHCLYFAKGSLYLLAEDLADNKVKTFSVPRVLAAELTDKAYDGERVDPERFFGSSFGIFRGAEAESVVLEVEPLLAGFLRERRWHESQRVVAKEGGRIELHLEVAVTPDLVQWVLGFGGAVTVAAPPKLRSKVLEEAKAVVGKYASTKGA